MLMLSLEVALKLRAKTSSFNKRLHKDTPGIDSTIISTIIIQSLRKQHQLVIYVMVICSRHGLNEKEKHSWKMDSN